MHYSNIEQYNNATVDIRNPVEITNINPDEHSHSMDKMYDSIFDVASIVHEIQLNVIMLDDQNAGVNIIHVTTCECSLGCVCVCVYALW